MASTSTSSAASSNAASTPSTSTASELAVKLTGQANAVSTAATGLNATKYYAFNKTGNIMLVSTTDQTSQIQQSIQDSFNEVSVYFAAMTKAIASTINPATNEPYSIYDYNALKHVIDSSGLFVQVTQEDIEYTSKSVGVTFSTELITALLGIVDGDVASVASFASSLVSSLSKASTSGKISVGGSGSKTQSSVGTITFVCEYLMGMPAISAIVSYAELEAVQQAVHVGPCFSEKSMKDPLTIHKDTYLFVTPTFIKSYAGDLDAVINNQAYNEFVGYLQSLLEGLAYITGIAPAKGGTITDYTLSTGTTAYQITGANFGDAKGTVSLGPVGKDNENAFTIKSWNNGSIQFTIPAKGTYDASVPLYVYKPGSTTAEAVSNDQYSIATTS